MMTRLILLGCLLISTVLQATFLQQEGAVRIGELSSNTAVVGKGSKIIVKGGKGLHWRIQCAVAVGNDDAI